MEDAAFIENMNNDLFVAVFDGHNGNRCSEFLKTYLLEELNNQLKQDGDLELALKKTYCNIDQRWLNLAKSDDCNDGSTGLCIVVQDQKIVVANTGDSRAIMNRAGKCIELNKDHRPTDPEEMKRIEGCGGQVIGGRLQGELAVSRAFGDYRFKMDDRGLLICEPEIRQFNITADIEFIVVACDGLYETFTNTEVIEYISRLLAESIEINEIAKSLAEEAIDRGSGDNITIIIIKFEKKMNKSLNSGRSSKKKQSYDEMINVKRKSIEFAKPLERHEFIKKPSTPRTDSDDLESLSDELYRPLSDSVSSDLHIISSLNDPTECDIKMKKKDGHKLKSHKKQKSKEYISKKLKKCKSKDDLPDKKKDLTETSIQIK